MIYVLSGKLTDISRIRILFHNIFKIPLHYSASLILINNIQAEIFEL